VEAYQYFNRLDKTDDLSIRAHVDLSCFIAASHMCMLAWLTTKRDSEKFGRLELLSHWHTMMEEKEGRKDRQRFYSDVVKQARSVSHYHLTLYLGLHILSIAKRRRGLHEVALEPSWDKFRH
jgi:hypothetical protein